MGSSCRRNTREFTFALPPPHRPFYHRYSLFILCCLASLLATNAAELLEVSTVTRRGCSQAERDALLTFKFSIQDPSNRLASWNSQHDCCVWIGVVCHNDTTTAHVYVVELNLANPHSYWENTTLQGEKLSPSLVSLAHLESLNLSWNDFGHAQIPEFIGVFQKLRYLDLQYSNFSGTVPPQLGNLSSLRHLDLSQNDFGGAQIPEFIGTFHKLRHLDLQYSNFSGTFPPQLGNLSSLCYLDLSWNNFGGAQIPEFIGVFQKLRYLDLQYSNFSGTVPPQLGNLSSLRHLDLSRNNFGGAQIPKFIGSLQKLRYLDLQYSNFNGTVPPQLGNLSSLRHLDLSENVKVRAQSLNWLTHLFALVYLDLRLVDLSVVSDSWLSIVNMLHSLQELKLSDCGLDQISPSLSHLNLTSLVTLDLSDNNFNSTLPNWLWQLTTLTYLDLSYSFHSTIPIGIEIGNLTSLKTLDLSGNSLIGHIPVEVGKLFNLTSLDLHSNSLEGVVSELHLANLTNLRDLDLSYNSLFTIDHNWAIPFQLQSLGLNSLMLGPRFPIWLKSHNSIMELSLSNTGIKGNLPAWFWTCFSTIITIDLSYNEITGTLPISMESFTNLAVLNLCSNLLEGPIPKFPINTFAIDLSNNSFSGPLPLDFSSPYYILSYNKIHGRIPLSICNSTQLMIIDLSHNQIFGEFPHCEWRQPSYLAFIHLGNNNLSGKIPISIGLLNNIQSLHLNNNNFNGEIPSSLQNCSELRLLDIGNNKLSGTIPTWIGQSLQRLVILRLRSNMFSGDIPLHIGQLSNLQIIDLSSNFLMGSIPSSLGNLSAFISTSETWTFYNSFRIKGMTTSFEEIDSISIVMKGYEYSYSKTLFLVKSIDLSTNHLDGEIPKELGSLVELQTLNLSRNYLNGNIPYSIGRMKSLETLDLSHNMLSGAIPQDLSTLNSLNHLNLSYNNLSGMIPQGYQLQTLQDASIYEGNTNLCGALIHKSCPGDKNVTIIDEEQDDSSQMLPEYLGIILGFLLSLWSVLVILLFKKDWRNSYFSIIDRIFFNKAFVLIKLMLNRWMVRQ